MKIRLTQPGYEAYTGLLGNLTFTSGVSDQDVSQETANGIANILRVERFESVDTASPATPAEQEPTDTAEQTETAEPEVVTEPDPV